MEPTKILLNLRVGGCRSSSEDVADRIPMMFFTTTPTLVAFRELQKSRVKLIAAIVIGIAATRLHGESL